MRGLLAPLIKLVAFLVITVMVTYVLAVTISNQSFGSVASYKANFTDVTGLNEGDDVRIAGVRVGTVESIQIVRRANDTSVAQVGFSVQKSRSLPVSITAAMRYRNLVGQRYLDVEPAAGGSTAVLKPGGTIPLTQTRPAVDLTVLFQGFQPLVQGLDPTQTNQLAYEVIQTLQGEGGAFVKLLSNLATLTNALADKDRVIGEVIDNLSSVLGAIGARDAELSNLIIQLKNFVSGLAKDRTTIGNAISGINNLATSTAGLLTQIRAPLRTDVKDLTGLAASLNRNSSTVQYILDNLAPTVGGLIRTAQYGSWFNFYLCSLSGDLTIGAGVTALKIPIPLAQSTGAGEVQLMAKHDDNGSDSNADYTTPVRTKRAPKLGKSFTSRNPTPIGAIGLVFILVLLVAAFNAASLPLIGGGTSYSAMFSTSANLKEGSDVRIAGVKVGEVQTVAIDRPAALVKVSFLVKDGWVGDDSFARIKLRTLLGAKYIEIDSQGTKQMKEGATIPRSRTESPFDVYPAFSALTDTLQKINTNQLAKAFNTLSSDFTNTPSSVKPVVTGLSRLSLTISSRDQQLRTLLSRTNSVTKVLADRSADLQTLLSDGNLLLAELNARRTAIHSLLINTQTLSVQLSGLVSDNQRTLDPLLTQVNKVLKQLNDNQDSLDRGLALLGPFYRVFNNVIGNGRWFDNYIQNLSIPGLLGVATGGG